MIAVLQVINRITITAGAVSECFLISVNRFIAIRFKIQSPSIKAIDGTWKVKSKYGAVQPALIVIDVMERPKMHPFRWE